MKPFHFTNAEGRDATVQYVSTPAPKPPRLGLPGQTVTFRRYLATTEAGLHEALQSEHGDEYHQALVDGDPEADLEWVGRRIGATNVVYLSSMGKVLHAPPELVEVIYAASGEERERREPQNVEPNVNDETPVIWSGRTFNRADVVRKFVFKRTLRLVHQDGLTYDHLFKLAQELDADDSVVLLGSGKKGIKPLVFQTNGTAYRAFLEGRVHEDGKRYQLLLHLSNMELKRPEPPPPKPPKPRKTDDAKKVDDADKGDAKKGAEK